MCMNKTIVGIRLFGIRTGRAYHYYAMEIDLSNGSTLKLDAEEMRELKEALTNPNWNA